MPRPSSSAPIPPPRRPSDLRGPRAVALPRRLAVALAAAGAGLLAAALVGLLVLRSSLPRTRGTLEVEGLEAAVDVVRDGAGVPFVAAESDRDALFGLGFVHAQDRLWQMEWQRRIGAGRLSEVVGEDALDIDRFLRTLGTYRAAERAAAAMEGEPRELLDAYVAGVNAFLSSGHPLPAEFGLLGVRPEPWRPADSLVWATMMAWNLGGNWDLELLRAWLVHRVGTERAAQLLPDYPEDGPTILGSMGLDPKAARKVDAPSPARRGDAGGLDAPGGAASSHLPGDVVDDDPLASAAAHAPGLLALGQRLRTDLHLGGPGVGSNGWAIAGRHTASGKPILANDPHLGTQIPSQWYLAGIAGDRLRVVGGTLPGLPAVIIGRNADIAWGFTNLGADVQDLYVERLDPAGLGRYWDGAAGGWQPIEVVEERIAVRGRGEPERWAARATRHGPLISDALDETPPVDAQGWPTALAMRWTALEGGDRSIEAFVALNRAGDWEAFRSAIAGFAVPNQNAIYADAGGRIGYAATGRVPVRGRGDGLLPVPGWDPAYDWEGDAPREAVPHAADPPTGLVVTANQRVTRRTGAPHLTNDWALPYRAARIERALQALVERGDVQLDQVAAIQLDTASDMAPRLQNAVFAAGPETGVARVDRAVRTVASWDGDNRADAVAPTIVQAWLLAAVHILLEDDLDDERLETYLTQDDLNHRNAEFALRAIAGGNDGPDTVGDWCDDVRTPAREDCMWVRQRALDDALDDLAGRLGPWQATWRWGRVHRAHYPHAPLSEVPLIRPLVHRSIAVGGDAFSPNVGPPSWAAPFDVEHAAGLRLLVDFRLPGAWFSIATGQSGHPLSPHYADRLRPHERSRSLGGDRLWIDLEAPVVGRVDVLCLMPATGRTVSQANADRWPMLRCAGDGRRATAGR